MSNLTTLETIKKCLVKANEREVITDTIWISDYETLFDFIDAAIEREKSELDDML